MCKKCLGIAQRANYWLVGRLSVRDYKRPRIHEYLYTAKLFRKPYHVTFTVLLSHVFITSTLHGLI